ncbi:TetR family transcriptional regulator [Actinophytocola oryzae]|uniref:TetR family transcriptional regulator n=1 Tax=Actinophytocola oryzae TaxID=502181 RepID=A0A4R7V7G0_9PSEU|nr:TetR family transcriptional regulator [Actinophytocola oryzae]
MSAARKLFAARGYQAVPADEIVRAAGVSRGALYHHYADKQGLFRAVVEDLEREITAEVAAALSEAPDVVTGMGAAFEVFLNACLRPEVQRISLTDAPAVLGWQAWREIEAEYGLGLLTAMLAQAIEDGVFHPMPVDALARLVLATVMEAAHFVAEADDQDAARVQVQQVLGTWFATLVRTD